jgi:hypothetical protein
MGTALSKVNPNRRTALKLYRGSPFIFGEVRYVLAIWL